MKILVIGYYYSMNLGDTVICDCVASWLRETFPFDEIVIRDIWGRSQYSGSPDVSMQMIDKQRLRVRVRSWVTQHTPYDSQLKHERYVLSKYGDAMQKIANEPCDMVVFAGGQLLTDLMSHELSFYINAFDKRHIPVFLHALGTGPCNSKNLKSELTEALRRPSVVYLSVRDHLQAVNERYFGINAGMSENTDTRRFLFSADPGLWADHVYHAEKIRKTDTIGLGIMYPGNIPTGTAVRFWKKLIYLLNKNNIQWQIFTNGDNRDQLFASYVLDQLPFMTGEEKSKISAPPASPEELVRKIGRYRGIISFRLHSHIIAASMNVPSVAILWDDKLREFFRLFGCEENCFSVSDSAEKVLEALSAAVYKGWPMEKVHEMREESREMLEQAINEYHI